MCGCKASPFHKCQLILSVCEIAGKGKCLTADAWIRHWNRVKRWSPKSLSLEFQWNRLISRVISKPFGKTTAIKKQNILLPYVKNPKKISELHCWQVFWWSCSCILLFVLIFYLEISLSSTAGRFFGGVVLVSYFLLLYFILKYLWA